MKRGRSIDGYGSLKDKRQENFVEDWVGGSPFHQDPGMFDSDNNNTLPNTQDWGHHNHWASSSPSFQVDHKRLALFSDATGPQRHGAYYWQYMNQCAQQEGMGLKPGIESWPYPASAAPTTSASTSSGVYSGRNADSIRPNLHGHSLPRPPHHLFATGGGPIPLSEGGPPSLPPPLLLHPFQLQLHPQDRSNRPHSRYPWETPPSYSASQGLRQRTGVDTPPRFSTSGNTIYPPSSLLHYESMSTAPPLSTLPYYSASPFGISSSYFRSQTNLHPGVQNPDSINYADHGCYSLPVTTATCDHQTQVNQTNRPFNFSSTPLAKQSASVAQNVPAPQRRGLHRRTLSDPGLVSLASSESNVIPSNPPPPPPPLRLDGWLKGKTSRGLSNRRYDEPSVSSVIQDTSRWLHSSEERKGLRLEQSKADEEVLRSNASGHSSSGSDLSSARMRPSKSAGNVQHAKSSCCCNSWSSPKKLAEEVAALKEANRKICRELRETRKELDDLKVMLPNPASLKHSNGPLSWQYSGLDYHPGMITELVQEVRDAARLREEAFLSHIHSSIISQGSSCGCGQALFQDGDDFSKKKLACWWWGRNLQSQSKSQQQQSPPTCSSLNSTVTATSKNKLISGPTELENLKELLQQVQDEKEQTNTRLKRVEEELSAYKLHSESQVQKNASIQESNVHIQMTKGDKVTPKESYSQRQGLSASKNEDPVNQEVAILKDDVYKLRLQLQNMSAARDPFNQAQKIEHLTALLRKVLCPSNGISLSEAGSAIHSTMGCWSSGLEEGDDNLHRRELSPAKKTSSTGVGVDKTLHGVASAKTSGIEDDIVGDQRVATDSSPPNSIESDCTSSSCSNNSNMDISSGPPPVTMHGPVTDL